MKNKSLLILCIVINNILNYSCNHYNEENAINEITTYYSSGSIHTKKQFLNDTILHGYYKRYHENGQLELLINYKNGKKHGILKEYYPNGNVFLVKNYYNDNLHGNVEQYFDNSRIHVKASYTNGVKWGPLIEYYNNGIVKSYLYYFNTGEVMYRIDYDKKGNISKEKGTGFPEVYVNSFDIHIDDTLIVDISYINPPHANPVLYIKKLDSNFTLINKHIVRSNSGKYIFKRKISTPSKYIFKLELVLETDKQNAKTYYEVDFEINVTN